jgi:hypothetical protein
VGWCCRLPDALVARGFSGARRRRPRRVRLTLQNHAAAQRAGLRRTDPLDRFACVEVVRERGARGWVRIRVSLQRAGTVRLSESPDYVVELYGSAGEAAEQEAREWGDRLARFLQLPLKVDL